MLKVVKDVELRNCCKVLSVLVQESNDGVAESKRKVAGLCDTHCTSLCKHNAPGSNPGAGCEHLNLAQTPSDQIIPQCVSKTALAEALDDEIEFITAARDQIKSTLSGGDVDA